MTVTPKVFTARVIKTANELDFEVASMDDGAKFGRMFHRLGFSEAIRHNLLTDYQVTVASMTAPAVLYVEAGTLLAHDSTEITDARA
ncbi:hypothetical protein [Mycobacterium sp. NPDC050853]|uniref:hypothetical protein n=1 Tax=Mycobacterium sp. NPDC050853 TaxID=3155160 RepID=UPI0033EF5145